MANTAAPHNRREISAERKPARARQRRRDGERTRKRDAGASDGTAWMTLRLQFFPSVRKRGEDEREGCGGTRESDQSPVVHRNTHLSLISPTCTRTAIDIISSPGELVHLHPVAAERVPHAKDLHRRNTCFGFDTYPAPEHATTDDRRPQRPPSTLLHNRRTLLTHLRSLSHKRSRSHPGRLRRRRCCWFHRPDQRQRGTIRPLSSNPRRKPIVRVPLGLRRRRRPHQVA